MGSVPLMHYKNGETVVENIELKCPKDGQIVSLKGSLDQVLTEIAVEVFNGKPYPSTVEVDRRLSEIRPITIRCGALSSDDCRGFKSVYDGGSIRCFRMEAMLVPK